LKPNVVLIVDNEPFNTDLVKTILTKGGFKVISANSGREALNAVKSKRPALVLMDLGLPGMDGFEITRQLLEKPENDELKVIAFSASAADEDRVHAFDAGCIDYIAKPIGARELIDKVKAHLG
jgi:DNA-binding response OmpR family regulator